MNSTELRNKLNENAECSWHEFKTTEIICDFFTQNNIKFERLPKNGLIVRKGVPNVLLRAELDGLSFGAEVKHACGHDVHMAALASVLVSADNVIGVFQPSEEDYPSGAKYVLDFIGRFNAGISLHVDPSIPIGKIGIRAGYVMGSVDLIKFKVTGKSAHTATPYEGKDAILASAEIIQKTHQAFIGKNCSVVISLINGGVKDNIVCEDVRMTGTSRALDEKLRFQIKDEIEKICLKIETEFQVKINFEFIIGYPSLYNSPELAVKLRKSLEREFEVIENNPRLGNDDFAFFESNGPICMIRIGCGTGRLHSKEFYPSDEVVEICKKVFIACAIHLN